MALGIAAEKFGLQPAFAVSAAICCALFLAVLPSYRTIISVIEHKPARP